MAEKVSKTRIEYYGGGWLKLWPRLGEEAGVPLTGCFSKLRGWTSSGAGGEQGCCRIILYEVHMYVACAFQGDFRRPDQVAGGRFWKDQGFLSCGTRDLNRM